MRENCAVPFRGEIQLHKFCSRNARLPSQWVATKSDWQTATPPPTVVLACDTRVKRNMNSFPILPADTFVSSVAGAVGALPSALSSPSQYKPFRVLRSSVRARYGNHFEHAVRMSEDAFHGLMGCLASPPTSLRPHNSQPSFPVTTRSCGAATVARAAGGKIAKGTLRSADGEVGEKRCDKLNHASSCVSRGMSVACCSSFTQRRVWPQARMLQRPFV